MSHQVEYTTIAAWPLALCKALAARGLDHVAILARVGLDYEKLVAEPEGRVPVAVMTRLWAEVEAVTGEESVGLAAGRFAHPMHLHAFGMLMMSCDSVITALEHIGRYYTMVTNSVTTRVVREEARLGLLVELMPDAEINPAGVDAFFAAIANFSQNLLPRSRDSLLHSVHLTRPRPREPKRWEDVFRCDVLFESEVNAIWFNWGKLQSAPLPGDPALSAHSEASVRRYVERLSGSSWSTRVRQTLLETLEGRELSLGEVAARLSLSERSLRRYLANENTGFRELVSQVRAELARHYLSNTDLPIAEIATRLGFSDGSNFNRACRRWFGVSPGGVRKKAGG